MSRIGMDKSLMTAFYLVKYRPLNRTLRTTPKLVVIIILRNFPKFIRHIHRLIYAIDQPLEKFVCHTPFPTVQIRIEFISRIILLIIQITVVNHSRTGTVNPCIYTIRVAEISISFRIRINISGRHYFYQYMATIISLFH